MGRKRIGVILSEAESYYQERLLKGVMTKAFQLDYDVLIFTSFVKVSFLKAVSVGEMQIYDVINYDKLDGVIVLADTLKMPGLFDKICRDIDEKCHVPVVFIDGSYKDYESIYTRDEIPFMQLTEHLIEVHGCRKTGEVFDTKDLLPDMEQVLGRHNCLMFSPLHFQDEVIGYAANSFSPIYFLFQNTRRFINNTNQIMESFKNRQRLERANAELARIHMLDPMTGIYNRRGFYKNVKKLISKAEKQGVGVWVFSIDMDNLKKINDLYGHNEGDKAIKAVASLMTKCTAEGGICSRFGGDEFVAVIAETDGADSFYEKVSRSIAEYNRRSKSPYDVSISCGYKAGKPKTLKEIDDLMKESDREMYTQKRKHHSRRD